MDLENWYAPEDESFHLESRLGTTSNQVSSKGERHAFEVYLLDLSINDETLIRVPFFYVREHRRCGI